MRKVYQSTAEWKARNKEHIREYNARYRAENKEKCAALDKAYKAAHRERIAMLTKKRNQRNAARLATQKIEWRLKNHPRFLAKKAEYRKANAAKILADNAARKAKKLRAMPVWAKPEAIAAVYQRAIDISKATGTPHHVDHVVPLNSPIVCGLHVEANLQVVPAMFNLSKSNTTWPDMPQRSYA